MVLVLRKKYFSAVLEIVSFRFNMPTNIYGNLLTMSVAFISTRSTKMNKTEYMPSGSLQSSGTEARYLQECVIVAFTIIIVMCVCNTVRTQKGSV